MPTAKKATLPEISYWITDDTMDLGDGNNTTRWVFCYPALRDTAIMVEIFRNQPGTLMYPCGDSFVSVMLWGTFLDIIAPPGIRNKLTTKQVVKMPAWVMVVEGAWRADNQLFPTPPPTTKLLEKFFAACTTLSGVGESVVRKMWKINAS